MLIIELKGVCFIRNCEATLTLLILEALYNKSSKALIILFCSKVTYSINPIKIRSEIKSDLFYYDTRT